ncbi:hypothetical protein, conserved, partial [Eimeria tenella]
AAFGAVGHRWGRYGIIHETDLWKKRPEFTLWLLEVKDKNIETLSNWEEKKLFSDFAEDFNTASLPHKKFYNLELWEAEERMRLVKFFFPFFFFSFLFLFSFHKGHLPPFLFLFPGPFLGLF